jgi:hypothetical protein
VIRKNQTLIFKKFIEDGHNRILKEFKDIDYISKIKSMMDDFREQKYTIDINNCLSINGEVSYIIAMIRLVSICSKDNNDFVSNICQTIIKLNDVSKLLKMDLIIPIKLAVIEYLNNVY